MGSPRKKILVAIARAQAVHKIEPFLSRSSMDIERASSGADALIQVSKRQFDLIVAGIPLTDTSVTRFVTELRQPSSPNSATPLLVLAKGSQLAAAKAYGSELVHFIGLEESSEKLRHLVAGSLGVALRLAVRLPVQIHVQLPDSDLSRVCVTRNISRSGMLLRTESLLPVGTDFAFNFTLPGTFSPLAGTARVVRHSDQSREKIVGIGSRFVDLPDGDKARLESFVESELALLDETKPRLSH